MREGPETRQSLLLRLRDAQDDQAWSEFLEIYEPLIYRLGRRHALQDADARELTQEVLLAVANAIDGWDPDPDRGSSFPGTNRKILSRNSAGAASAYPMSMSAPISTSEYWSLTTPDAIACSITAPSTIFPVFQCEMLLPCKKKEGANIPGLTPP